MTQWHINFKAPQLVAIALVFGLAVTCLTARSSGAQDAAPPAAQTTTEEVAPPAGATIVGTATCLECHDEAIAGKLREHTHGLAMTGRETAGKGQLCEGCHGPGSRHAEDPSNEQALLAIKQTASSGKGCLVCHNERLSPAKWQRSEHHQADVNCLACHLEKATDPHGPVLRAPDTEKCLSCHGQLRGQLRMPSHHPVQEGRVACADCHKLHEPEDEKTLNKETCRTCHQAQRGPHRFAHGAISSDLNEGCVDCHRPHGSPNQRLLKVQNRGLCLQCHADKVSHFPARRCWDCHQAVHGSNSSRRLFTK